MTSSSFPRQASVPAPRVSVVVPNFNHARFLDQRLKSVLNQSLRDLEVLYLDDASTDDSEKVFRCYAGDPRVRAIRSSLNSGSPFKQWNRGVREARGELVWIAEADDFADEKLLETLVAVLDNHPRVGLAYCQSQVVDETGRASGTMDWWTRDLDEHRWQSDFCNSGDAECRRFLAQKNTLPNASAVVFRRDVFLAAGGAPESMRVCGDWMCWAKCLQISDVAFVAQPLNSFRKHSGSVSVQTQDNGVLTLEKYQVLGFIAREVGIEPPILHRVCEGLIDEWMGLAFCSDSLVSARQNAQIYRAARRADPRLDVRLARRVTRGALRRLRKRAFATA